MDIKISSELLEFIIHGGDISHALKFTPEQFKDKNEALYFKDWICGGEVLEYFDVEHGASSIIYTIFSPNEKVYEVQCPYYSSSEIRWHSDPVELEEIEQCEESGIGLDDDMIYTLGFMIEEMNIQENWKFILSNDNIKTIVDNMDKIQSIIGEDYERILEEKRIKSKL